MYLPRVNKSFGSPVFRIGRACLCTSRGEHKTREIEDSVPAENFRFPVSKRVANFSAGPSALPVDVLYKAQQEFLNWQGTGMGFMEMSHRDVNGPVHRVMTQVVGNLRKLLNIPTNYHVLFYQGGAHAQFAAVPLNLLGSSKQADYVNSGFWSRKAIDEASKYCKVNVVVDCTKNNFTTIPHTSEWALSNESAYVHFCANETIFGLEFLEDPHLPGKVLATDMTSTLLSRPVEIKNYGLIYASGGKNLGPAGVAVVIVRDDLLGKEQPFTPSILSYKKFAETNPISSVYNTPPTYLIYLMGLVLENMLAKGGIEYYLKKAIERSSSIYEIIDNSKGFYINKVDPKFRSRMNIPFRIHNEQLEKKFLSEAEKHNMFQLFGHPLFGGLRITLYNGIPDQAVADLIHLLHKFQQQHQQR